MKTKIDYELIAVVVKKGYSDYVVSAGRSAGATGATVLLAYGTDNANTQEFLGLSVHPEKEVVLIVSKRNTKRKIMKMISDSVDLKQDGGGVCFSLPITNIVGFMDKLS